MPETSIVLPSKPNVISENETYGQYEINGLYPGYGHTLGNSLRRIILSSLPGSAITTVKIDGVNNEFSTMKGVKEDVITILLNLKNVRVAMHTDEPQTLSLKVSEAREITAGDIETTGEVEIANPDHVIAHITDKKTELDMTMTVEKGLGYVPKDVLQQDKAEIGTINMDAVFTPIRRVNYEVENMRVGERTDFNRLRLFIETDGTMTPHSALEQSVQIMKTQLDALISDSGTDEPHETTIETESVLESTTSDIPSSASEEEPSEEETEFLKTRIEDLDLSSRTMNALANANIRTVGGLARKKEADLLEIEGLGEKSVEEIKSVLSEHSVELKR